MVELLADAPTRGVDETAELTTPTGAAILAGLVTAWGPLPAMRIAAHGFGAGTRDLDGRPNLTQVVLGDLDAGALDAGQPVVLLETNVDDVTGEVLAHTVAALLDVGAHDAWLSPVVMKKGRPGHVVHALADVAVADSVRRVMVAETGSLGVRGHRLERWPEPRHTEVLDTDGGDVRLKVGPVHAKVEYEDAARLAVERRLPLRAVQRALEDAWRQDSDAGRDASEDAGDEPGSGHEHHHVRPDWTEEGPADPVA